MKQLLKSVATRCMPLWAWLVDAETRITARWAASAFRRLRSVQRLLPRISLRLERGVTSLEIGALLKEVGRRLGANGIFSGYAIGERSNGTKSLAHHEYECRDKADSARFFRPYFRHVTVFETIYPERHNLYFRAGQGALPFVAAWLGGPCCANENAKSDRPPAENAQ